MINQQDSFKNESGFQGMVQYLDEYGQAWRIMCPSMAFTAEFYRKSGNDFILEGQICVNHKIKSIHKLKNKSIKSLHYRFLETFCSQETYPWIQ